MDVLWILISIATGGAVTYFVTTRFIHRPKLNYNLRPAAFLDPREFGKSLDMTLKGEKVNNLAVFTLEISLKGHADITQNQIPQDQKPTIFLPGFSVFDVRTLNNDETRFDIPLGIAASGSMIVINLNRIRAGSTAIFQIIGTFQHPDTDLSDFGAQFYPGVVVNVDTITTGSIERPWKKEK